MDQIKKEISLTPDRVEQLKELIPFKTKKELTDDKAKTYFRMIENIVGVDGYGNPRPWEDVSIFLYTCKRTRLDPVIRQIYAVWRWNSTLSRNVMSIQTGIDGMRLVAQRTGEYAGQDDIVYEEKDGKPTKATCTLYRMVQGQKVSYSASARYSEYVQMVTNKEKTITKPNTMWESKPFIMLGKCAEALALRKGFPNELSGIYADVEIEAQE
jgi:phage recombination protein Bet